MKTLLVSFLAPAVPLAAVAALADADRKLEVRAYGGLPLFGRSQVWERVE